MLYIFVYILSVQNTDIYMYILYSISTDFHLTNKDFDLLPAVVDCAEDVQDGDLEGAGLNRSAQCEGTLYIVALGPTFQNPNLCLTLAKLQFHLSVSLVFVGALDQ